jgi:hypothetical protein
MSHKANDLILDSIIEKEANNEPLSQIEQEIKEAFFSKKMFEAELDCN